MKWGIPPERNSLKNSLLALVQQGRYRVPLPGAERHYPFKGRKQLCRLAPTKAVFSQRERTEIGGGGSIISAQKSAE